MIESSKPIRSHEPSKMSALTLICHSQNLIPGTYFLALCFRNGPILTGFALVLIDIVPVNNNPPQIIETTTGSTNSFLFPENQAVGSQLVGITLSASDADSGQTWFVKII